MKNYKIKIRNELSKKWAPWFEGFEISYEDDVTVLTALRIDQAALHGALNKIRDLNLELISIEQI